MTAKKCIAVVGESESVRRLMGQKGDDLIHGGWTTDKNFLKDVRALEEIGKKEMYGLVVVNIKNWKDAEAMGERICDGLAHLGVSIPVAVLDDRRLIEKKQKVAMVPRKEVEVIAMARMFGIIA